MLMPPIDRYMTRQPWTVTSRATLADAKQLMRDHQIRHLPVVDEGKLIGIVSDRDLCLLQAVAGVAVWQTRVIEAMTEPVYTATPEAGIDEVANTMSEHKYGAAVIMRTGGAVEGIFTTVDACRALMEILQRTVS